MSQNEKILIIRFSSFGDIVQSLSLPSVLAQHFVPGPSGAMAGTPGVQIDWVTRNDMAPLLGGHPHLRKVFAFNRKDGLRGLCRLGFELRREKYTRVYDAHNNIRSRLLSFILLGPFSFFTNSHFIRRSIRRWKRLLLFRFRINTFEQPFSGQRDLIEPLQAWGLPKTLPPPPQIFLSAESEEKARQLLGNFRGAIALAPSAAHFLKRWPQDHWQALIQHLPEYKFILLGGPEDAFLENIAHVAPERVLNLAGKSSLLVSASVVKNSSMLIANDTGLLHVAEQLGMKCIALMGPAPFGFPSRPTTRIMQLDLACRPCSKHGQGPCVNKKFHQCLVDITPDQVALQVKILLGKDSR